MYVDADVSVSVCIRDERWNVQLRNVFQNELHKTNFIFSIK